MPSNYKTKICKQFAEEPFYCPYGEKCQFVHISLSKDKLASNDQIKYTDILNETLAQAAKRITVLEDSESFEFPSALFSKPRLPVFKYLTDNCNDYETQPNSSDETHLKKPTLSKRSREFHMPKVKKMEVSPFLASKIRGGEDIQSY